MAVKVISKLLSFSSFYKSWFIFQGKIPLSRKQWDGEKRSLDIISRNESLPSCLPSRLPLNSPAHSKPNLREILATASLFCMVNVAGIGYKTSWVEILPHMVEKYRHLQQMGLSVMRLHTKRLRCELTLLGDTKEAPETTEKWGVRSRRWNCFLEKVFHDNDNDLTRIIVPFIQEDPQRAVQMPYASSFQTIMEMFPLWSEYSSCLTTHNLTSWQHWAGSVKIMAGRRENLGHWNITA